MASALFDINSDGQDQGYEASNAEVLTLRLRQQPPIGVTTVAFQVFDAGAFDATRGIAANPPRASKNAPVLTIVGATSGQLVSPSTVDGSVTITMPSSGAHSWIVRCIVNLGQRTLPNGTTVADPSLIHERGIYIPTGEQTRKVVCTEVRQFGDGGWADALADVVSEGAFARRRARVVRTDETFMFGGTTSGTIGKLGWNLLGSGTPAFSRSSANNGSFGLSNAGRVALVTSTASNDRTTLCAGNTESRGILTAFDVRLMQLAHTFNNSTTSKRFFFGLHGDFSQVPSSATNCLGLFYDSSVGGNWLLLTRAGGVGSAVDSGVAVAATADHLLTIYQPPSPGGTFQFYVGATLLGTLSAGLPAPTTEMNLGIMVQTLTTASRSHYIGRFTFESVQLSGAMDDDTFLDA
jgi:hypothetical protein